MSFIQLFIIICLLKSVVNCLDECGINWIDNFNGDYNRDKWHSLNSCLPNDCKYEHKNDKLNNLT